MKDGLQEEHHDDGSINSQYWYNNGNRHKEDGPAVIYYYEDGSIRYQGWYKDGKYHREDGPAYIWYNEDGSISSQHWYKDDRLHREDGPATIYYYKDGSIRSQEWYNNGKELTKILKKMLVVYMASHDLTLAELLLSNDELIRTSAQSYKWKNIS